MLNIGAAKVIILLTKKTILLYIFKIANDILFYIIEPTLC
jgi:hypothetical protein